MSDNYWSLKPPLGTPIDWSNPLSRGLVGSYLFNEGSGDKVYNLVTGIPADITTLWTSTYKGCELDFGTEAQHRIVTFSETAIAKLPATGKFSIIVANTPCTGATGNAYLYQWWGAIGNLVLLPNGSYDTGGYRLYINGTIGSEAGVNLSNTFNVAALTAIPGSQHMYHDGKLVISGTSDLSALSDVSSGILGASFDTGNVFGGTCLYCYLWNRKLTANEVMSLYGDPYQIIGPSLPVWWYPTESGTEYKDFIDTSGTTLTVPGVL